MPIDVHRFVAVRPALYHSTDRENVRSLAQGALMEPAAALIRQAGRTDLLGRRRSTLCRLTIGTTTVILKDQVPLRIANMLLPDGWTESELVAYLDEHVFFWPGTTKSPVRQGERLISHYRPQGPAILRIPTANLFAANPEAEPLFCAFNSGAPRMQSGRRVTRGPDLFLPAASFPRTEGKVVELVFRSPVTLPDSTEVMLAPGRWMRLTDTAA